MFLDMMVDQVMKKKYNSYTQFLSLISDEWTEIKSNKSYVLTNVREVDGMLHMSINFLSFLDQLDDIKGETVANAILETLQWRDHLSSDHLKK